MYLNPDGRKVAIYQSRKGRRKAAKPEIRYTVYGKNWKVVDASHEGFKNLQHAIANVSRPAPMPPIPELGSGVYWDHKTLKLVAVS